MLLEGEPVAPAGSPSPTGRSFQLPATVPFGAISRVLLAAGAVAFIVSAWFALWPVTNPGVQQCGSPLVFAVSNQTDLRLPAPGSAEEPPEADKLRAQERCRLRVDNRLWISFVAVGIGVVFAGLGAVIGLIDDRRDYRRSPRFESYLRERPPGMPSDPWDQPVVPVDDLGRRLPDLEWREVRVVVAAGVAALVGLPLLAPWSVVSTALGDLAPVWVLEAVVLVVATYPVAAAALLGAAPYPTLLSTSLASSFTGRLLPEYGPQGLAVHQLVRAGTPRRHAIDLLAALDAAAVSVHAILLVLVGLAAVVARGDSGTPLSWEWVVWLVVVIGLGVGALTARRRFRTLVIRPDRNSLARLAAMPTADLARVLGSCAGLALLDALVLVASVRAFAIDAPVVPVVAVSLLASALAALAPTPDGEGIVEAVLVLGLVWAGVDAGPAVAGALLARLLRFWLPMLPGWFALRRLQRNGVV